MNETTFAGLLYSGGAWWVTSVRGDSKDAVLAGLRELAPTYRADRLTAIVWTDKRENLYQRATTCGAMLQISLHEPGTD